MSEYLKQMLAKGTPYDQIVPIQTHSYAELVEKLKNDKPVPNVMTGLKDFDDLIGGFAPGRLYVLSAPTKQGKTTMAQTIMYHMALEANESMMFSYEMGWKEVTQKFWAMDKQKYPATNLPLFFPVQLQRGGDNVQMQWIFEAIAKAKVERNVKFVVIDHLHFLLPLTELKNASFVIGGIVRELKRIASIIDIPIMLIAHVQKIKDDKIPDWTDIRDSSFITQEADVTMMMYRKKNENTPKKVSAQENLDGDTYSNMAVLSMELDRVQGKSKKMKFWHNGIMFEPYLAQDVQDMMRK